MNKLYSMFKKAPKIPIGMEEKYDNVFTVFADNCNEGYYEMHKKVNAYFKENPELISHKNNIIDYMIFTFITEKITDEYDQQDRDRFVFILKCLKED